MELDVKREGAEPLWKSEDVAKYLGVSRSWVYHAVERGALPHLRPAGLLRFDAAAIRAYARGVELQQKIVPIRRTVDAEG